LATELGAPESVLRGGLAARYWHDASESFAPQHVPFVRDPIGRLERRTDAIFDPTQSHAEFLYDGVANS
jgi:hypothetical protein